MDQAVLDRHQVAVDRHQAAVVRHQVAVGDLAAVEGVQECQAAELQ